MHERDRQTDGQTDRQIAMGDVAPARRVLKKSPKSRKNHCNKLQFTDEFKVPVE